MLRSRLSFTERRRRALHLEVDRLDRLEGRNAVTPIGAAAMGFGAIGSMHAIGGGNALIGSSPLGSAGNSTVGRAGWPHPGSSQSLDSAFDRLDIGTVPEAQGGQGSGGAFPDVPATGPVRRGSPDPADDPTVGLLGRTEGSEQAAQPSGLSTPWKPASQSGAGGGALPPRGGSGSIAAGVAIATTKSAAMTRHATPNSYLIGLRVGLVGVALDARAQRLRGGLVAVSVGHDHQPQRPGHALNSKAARARPARQQARTAHAVPGLHPDHPGLQRRLGHGPRLRPARHPRRHRGPPRPGGRLGLRHLHLLLDHHGPDRRHRHQRRQHLRPDLPLGHLDLHAPRPNRPRSP